MLPILGKPIVERVMEVLGKAGVRDFILVVNPKDVETIGYFTGKGVRFAFQEEPLGTAHALMCASPFIEGDFLLAACDNIFPPAHISELIKCQSDAATNAALSLMKVKRSEISQVGIVEMEEGFVKSIVEKPSLDEAPTDIGSMPLYALPMRILDYLEEVPLSVRGEYEIQDAIQMLIEREGGVRGVFTDWRLDLTTPDDLLAINIHFLARGFGLRLPESPQVGEGTDVIPPVRIEEGVSIGEGCVVGPYVYMERGSRLGSSVVVREAVILEGAEVKEEEVVIRRIIYESSKSLGTPNRIHEETRPHQARFGCGSCDEGLR
jgi:bifunctional UDP-N-acetylglucosamine pyrophosphorylase/glucosamine-1-phosphate N-acetyltransferase